MNLLLWLILLTLGELGDRWVQVSLTCACLIQRDTIERDVRWWVTRTKQRSWNKWLFLVLIINSSTHPWTPRNELANRVSIIHLFVTELIFCKDLKSNTKIPLTFCGGNQDDVNFLVGKQKKVIPLTLYYFRCNTRNMFFYIFMKWPQMHAYISISYYLCLFSNDVIWPNELLEPFFSDFFCCCCWGGSYTL